MRKGFCIRGIIPATRGSGPRILIAKPMLSLRTPTVELGWQFVKERVTAGHHDDVVDLSWSSDSNFFVSSSKDLDLKAMSIQPAP